MQLNLTSRFLAERYRGLIGWAIGLASYSVLIVSIFPTVRDSDSFAAALEDYPDALKELLGGEVGFDLTSGPGFLGAELYYLVLPLLLAVVAIGYGAALGAEQENGLIDLILANPIPRWRVVLERAVAILVAVVVLTTVVALTVAVSGQIVDLDVGLSRLAAASVAVVLLVVLHGLVAMATAALTGSRAVAVGAATVLFAAGYLLNVASGVIDWLEPARLVSPYHHATGSSPLVTGWAFDSLAVLAAGTLAVLAMAVIAFERRDLA